MVQINRRLGMTLFVGALMGVLAGCQASGTRTLSASEASGLRISSIRVDVSPLVQRGWGANSERVKVRLTQELRQVFADRIDPRAGATLNVRVTGVTLSTFVDNSTGFMGGGSNDYMESETTVLVGGVEQARYPMLSVLPSNSSGPWYLPGIDQRRLVALTNHHAAWLRRTIIGR